MLGDGVRAGPGAKAACVQVSCSCPLGNWTGPRAQGGNVQYVLEKGMDGVRSQWVTRAGGGLASASSVA